MILAAAITGLLAAYYYGVRPGVWVAAATAGLFLLALFWPPAAMFAYLAVAGLVVGVCMTGPRLGRPGRVNVIGVGRKLLGWARRLAK